jgi:hypothetical protein
VGRRTRLKLLDVKADLLLERVESLHRGLAKMALDFADLEREVAANTDAVQSSVTLLDRLAAELEAAKGDPARVQGVVDQLRANSRTLSEATVRNTPADPAPGPTPPPAPGPTTPTP